MLENRPSKGLVVCLFFTAVDLFHNTDCSVGFQTGVVGFYLVAALSVRPFSLINLLRR